jgi:hypothetical protein
MWHSLLLLLGGRNVAIISKTEFGKSLVMILKSCVIIFLVVQLVLATYLLTTKKVQADEDTTVWVKLVTEEDCITRSIDVVKNWEPLFLNIDTHKLQIQHHCLVSL